MNNEIQRRLDRLERENRTVRRVGLTIVLIAGAALLMAQAPARSGKGKPSFASHECSGYQLAHNLRLTHSVFTMASGEVLATCTAASGEMSQLMDVRVSPKGSNGAATGACTLTVYFDEDLHGLRFFRDGLKTRVEVRSKTPGQDEYRHTETWHLDQCLQFP